MKDRVLVVGRAAPQRELLRAILTLEGFEVVVAAHGEEALALLQARPPDLVLLDIHTPGKGGYELCAQIKREGSTRLIPVVLLASFEELEERVKALEAGADDFLRKPISRAELLARVKSLLITKHLNERLVEAERIALTLAASVEAKDPYAQGHLEGVVSYALGVGSRLGLSPREQEELRRGAILHDVGKVKVRESVLLKPGPLTPEEWEEVKTHPLVGAQICQPLGEPVVGIIRHHHERYDGRGYPYGLAGEAIPLLARIVCLADAYSSLTLPRPYRPAQPEEQARRTLQEEAGKQFDPHLVELFLIDLASHHLLE